MNQRLISEIGRTQRLDIINSLKRTKGMSVNELVERMGMSYMGIKQHCITLHRDGYLDTWRRPQKMGRPEMVYRLTRRTHDLFHAESHQFTLDLLKAAEDIYGPNAPEKLLYSIFKKKTAALKAKAKGETVAERAKWLAHVRDGEGHMAEFLNNEKDGGSQILECHSPASQRAGAVPDRGPVRAGHVRSRVRDACSPRSESQLRSVRVRVLLLRVTKSRQ